MVTTQQEKLLGEKEVVIERQKHELQGIKDDLAKKQEEVRNQINYMYMCIIVSGIK